MTASEQKLSTLGELLIEAAESGRQVERRNMAGSINHDWSTWSDVDYYEYRLAAVPTYYRVFIRNDDTVGVAESLTPFDVSDTLEIIKDFTIIR